MTGAAGVPDLRREVLHGAPAIAGVGLVDPTGPPARLGAAIVGAIHPGSTGLGIA